MQNNVFEKARNISLTSFLESQTKTTGRPVSGTIRFSTCPNCGESPTESVKLAVLADDSHWHCFRCRTKGSTVDAAALLWGVTPKEAAEKLAGEIISNMPSAKPKVAVEELNQSSEVRYAKVKEAVEKIHAASLSHQDNQACMDYLVKERCLPESLVKEAINRKMLGFIDPEKARSILAKEVGRPLLEEAGMWKPDKKCSAIAFKPIVFFYPGFHSAEFRMIGSASAGNLKSIRYGKARLPMFWKGDRTTDVMVVEGFIDMLSIVALGFKGSVMCLPSCNIYSMKWFDYFAKRYGVKKWLIGLDNDSTSPDNPGQTWAAKLLEELTESGKICEVRSPASGDINDVLKSRVASLQLKAA